MITIEFRLCSAACHWNTHCIFRFQNTVATWTRKISAKMHSIWFLRSMKSSHLVTVKAWTCPKLKPSSKWTHTKRKCIWLFGRRKSARPNRRCVKRQRSCNANAWRLANAAYRWDEAEAAAPVIAVVEAEASEVFPVHRCYHSHLLALARRLPRQLSKTIKQISIRNAQISHISTLLYRKPAPTRNALKLGGKSKDVDSFVDQLKSEGQKVTNLAPTTISSAAAPVARAKTSVPTEE